MEAGVDAVAMEAVDGAEEEATAVVEEAGGAMEVGEGEVLHRFKSANLAFHNQYLH